MNSLVDLHCLCRDHQANTCRIMPLPDEPTFSYVTRVMLLTAEMNRARVVEQLFGCRNVRPERPLHAGIAQFAQLLGGSASDTLIDEHSMLAFFKPFADPDRYSHACKLALGPRSNGMNELVGLREGKIFRTHPAVCLDCVRSDEERPPFSYYRRSHQVAAVSHCATHQTPLILGCSCCGATFSHWELPSLNCHHCGEPLTQAENNSEVPPDIAARIRLSKMIEAVFSGEVPAFDSRLRLAAIRDRTKQVVRTRSGVVGDNLATHLNRIFGLTFLASLGLQTQSAPTLGWPALLIYGRFMAHDPIANCLILAALFDSAEDYCEVVSALQSSNPDLGTKPKSLLSPGHVSFSMLRDTFRVPSLNAVVLEYGQKHFKLKKWIAAYPGLSDRRAAFLFWRKLRGYKKDVQKWLRDNPRITRTQLTAQLGSAIIFIQRHDPQWLDQNLPVQKKLHGAVATARQKASNAQDDELYEKLSNAVKQVLARRGRPIRLSLPYVIRMSGLSKTPADMRENYPKTIALVNQVCEDLNNYYRRCLQWAAKILAWQYGTCDNLVELFVHARVGLQFVKPLECYARSLLNQGQAGYRSTTVNGDIKPRKYGGAIFSGTENAAGCR